MFLIGHQTQWNFLIKLIQNQRIPQAIIFSGQEKLGKKKIALEFIKLLNCQKVHFQNKEKEITPCQFCISCKTLQKNRSPNLFFLEPIGKEIQIDQIRNLQTILSLKPQLGNFKTTIIDRAETLNSEAQNCLLKNLEEPKGQVLLILITSQLERLLPTIRSRCQILKFFPVPFLEISEKLKGKVKETRLKKIFFLSSGRPGQVIDFLEKPEEFSQAVKIFQEGERILKSELFEKFIFISRFFRKEISLKEIINFLNNLENYLRLVLLKKIGVKNEILDSFNLKETKNYSYQKLKENLENIQILKNLISYTNINLKLALENLFLNLEPS